MRRSHVAVRAGLVAVLAFSTAVMPVPAFATAGGLFDGNRETTERIGDDDPVRTAIAISQARFADDTAWRVVLARTEGFADALAGAPLLDQGPLLLTPSSALAPAVADELRRVLPPAGTVYLLGGPGALAPTIEQQLRGEGFAVRRLSGASRVETAVAVAHEVHQLHPHQDVVALARSDDWADSVTGGALAARDGMPLLVTPPGPLHPAVAAALPTFGANELLLLGGVNGVSEEAEEQAIRALGDDVLAERLAGPSRAATAVAIATRFVEGHEEEDWIRGMFRDRFLLVNGYAPGGWAFGLPAAGLAAELDMPMLLASVDELPEETAVVVDGCLAAHADVLAVGGPAQLGGTADQTAGCDDERFLCDVWTDRELRPIVRPRWTFGMPPADELEAVEEGLDEGGLAGVCIWMTERLDGLVAMQMRGRDAFDQGREDLEDQGSVEDASGFDGEAYSYRDEFSMGYVVYDGEWTWTVAAVSLGGDASDHEEPLRTLMELLIERRG